jgi:membrane-associated phospholipid phosphatase
MRAASAMILALALAPSSELRAQDIPTPQASPSGVPVSSTANSPAQPSDSTRDVSWRKLIPNLAGDQKRIWTFPVALAHGKHWVPTLVVLGTTAALVALDPHEGSYFRRTTSLDGFNRVFSSNNTSLGIILPPTSLYFAGLIRRDSKMKSTALLAGEALADAEIVATVFKDADRRLRPAAVPANGNFSDTWFDDHTRFLRSNGSFPSGHSIAAFSVATVIARRYGNHRWVPYVAYGGAALIGFSRMSLSAHFASDVFMGGALGYTIARFTVLHQ